VFYQLGQKDKARHWLEKAANYHPIINEEDVKVNYKFLDINVIRFVLLQSKKEAEQLLKQV